MSSLFKYLCADLFIPDIEKETVPSFIVQMVCLNISLKRKKIVRLTKGTTMNITHHKTINIMTSFSDSWKKYRAGMCEQNRRRQPIVLIMDHGIMNLDLALR